MHILALAFLLTALLYASVGFGGGSTYTALLVLFASDKALLPAVSLVCNIIVVTGGSIRFARNGLVPWRRIWPFMVFSAGLAYLGGRTRIEETTFIICLAMGLILAAVALFLQDQSKTVTEEDVRPRKARDMAVGGGIGYFSGLVGIGGGIFLSPWLYFTSWGKARHIAATASVFILVNSISGLAGQLQKLSENGRVADLLPYWPLALAVFIGGQAGSYASIKALSPDLLRKATAALMILAAAQLLWKLFG
jgi:uncharacterized protein